MKIPILKGFVDLANIKPYDADLENGNTIANLNINGAERVNGEFTYPAYQDEFLLVGELSTTNMGIIDDHIVIRIKLFTNQVDKEFLSTKNGIRMELAVNTNNKTVYQTGKNERGTSTTKIVGECYYEFTEDFQKTDEQKNKAEYINSNLPYSRFD